MQIMLANNAQNMKYNVAVADSDIFTPLPTPTIVFLFPSKILAASLPALYTAMPAPVG